MELRRDGKEIFWAHFFLFFPRPVPPAVGCSTHPLTRRKMTDIDYILDRPSTLTNYEPAEAASVRLSTQPTFLVHLTPLSDIQALSLLRFHLFNLFKNVVYTSRTLLSAPRRRGEAVLSKKA